jgi:dipeptidase D
MVMRHVLFARVIRQKGNCSMGVLDGLEPQKVFQYFEEICRIPHGSGNVEAISNHLLRFAKERGLECYQDKLKNIIIIKEAAPGYEQEEPFILQGHMDMVAVKDAD